MTEYKLVDNIALLYVYLMSKVMSEVIVVMTYETKLTLARAKTMVYLMAKVMSEVIVVITYETKLTFGQSKDNGLPNGKGHVRGHSSHDL